MPEDTDRWNARLKLGFSARSNGRTVLDEREHAGPILVQRALYPEGFKICHVAVVHPPAGIAGGDTIDISLRVGPMAQATLTTPGATRWYKANARQALQTVRVTVASGGRLEWLPLENIFFEETNAVSRNEFDLESGAAALGWELSQFGRVSTSTGWNRGHVRTENSLKIDGKLLWVERGQIGASDDVRWDMPGMACFPVCGTLWCFGACLNTVQTEELANLMPWEDDLRAGSTMIPHDDQQALYLIRSVGVHVEEMMALMIKVWRFLRLRILHNIATPLRIWAT